MVLATLHLKHGCIYDYETYVSIVCEDQFSYFLNLNFCNLFFKDADMMIDDKFFRKVQPNCWSPEERLKEMDETGILP